jgi:hypothetical protein
LRHEDAAEHQVFDVEALRLAARNVSRLAVDDGLVIAIGLPSKTQSGRSFRRATGDGLTGLFTTRDVAADELDGDPPPPARR